jgi:integrase
MGRKPKKRVHTGPVKLREKVLANGGRSLYLDIYHAGKRSYDFLNLHLTGVTEHDTEIWRLAETIRNQRELEVRSAEHGITPAHLRKSNFIEFVELLAKERGHKSWDATLMYLKDFSGGALPFYQVTPAKLDAFKRYLLERVKQNTAWLYYGKIKTALGEAVKRDILQTNPASKSDGIGRAPSTREFLTVEELKALKGVDCPSDDVRRAFLFCCFTGLAQCDVRDLTWEQIRDGWVKYQRRKTKQSTSIALHQEALAVLGPRGAAESLVFPDLPGPRYVGTALTKWAQRAGVTKNVTFHVARHTFATMSITHGVDIYTVSKLMGHASVHVTQEYAKVIDRKKYEAMQALPAL